MIVDYAGIAANTAFRFLVDNIFKSFINVRHSERIHQRHVARNLNYFGELIRAKKTEFR